MTARAALARAPGTSLVRALLLACAPCAPLLAAALLLAGALLVGCGGAAHAPPSSASGLLGREAPMFKRPALDGSAFDLASARGKVTVVKFVAKYCEPCKRTLPAIERLHEAHPEIVVVGVSEDEHESEARELATAFGLSFPVVHDASNVLAGRFRVSELPVTFVLDGTGNVAWVGGPEKTESDLVSAIEATKP